MYHNLSVDTHFWIRGSPLTLACSHTLMHVYNVYNNNKAKNNKNKLNFN